MDRGSWMSVTGVGNVDELGGGEAGQSAAQRSAGVGRGKRFIVGRRWRQGGRLSLEGLEWRRVGEWEAGPSMGLFFL